MCTHRLLHILTLGLCVLTAQARLSAQVVEAVGSRALGMGGAFVAVASDSSATWWNPAGLAAGSFVDLAIGQTRVAADHELPAWRQKASWFTLATPPVGLAYYRFRITDIQPFDPTEEARAGREEGRVGVPVRSLSASQMGVTLVQTLTSGVHAGATLKYVRGQVHVGGEDGLADPSDLLDRGEALDGGDADGRFDLDVGLLAVAGVFRLGASMRNALEPEFGTMRLPRQARVGVAFDPEPATGVPVTIAFDADIGSYATASGPRRVMALGAEQWFVDKRLGIRAGGRMNRVGARERAATAGASVAVRSGTYVEGHLVHGGSAEEQGWGVAARVSF